MQPIYTFRIRILYWRKETYIEGIKPDLREINNADIQISFMILGGINLVVSAMGMLTLLIGLIMIANDLPKSYYDAIP